MDSLFSAITVLSGNVRGIHEKNKCKDVLDYLNGLKTYIICLQDTHWADSDLRKIKNIWIHKCLTHGKSTNSRGVTILLQNSFEYKIQNIYKDETGNIIVVRVNVLVVFVMFSFSFVLLYALNRRSLFP